MFRIQKLSATIAKIVACNERLKVFRIRLPKDADFAFSPGQFVMVSLPGVVDKEDRLVAKAFSIASSPSERGFIELCVALFPGGALSPSLFRASVGDEVIVKGPYGIFTLREPVLEGTVFIAGGTGLSPLMSMLRTVYSDGQNRKLWLFYTVHTPDSLLFRKELEDFLRNRGLSLVLSATNPDSGWKGETGRITELFPAYADRLGSLPKQSRIFYLCGPPAMVSDTVNMLERLGFSKENIHTEEW